MAVTQRDRRSPWVGGATSPWTVHDPSAAGRRNPRSVGATLFVAAAVLVAVAAGAAAVSTVRGPGPELEHALGRQSGPLADPTEISTRSAWRTDAVDPAVRPADAFAIGPFAYGDPLADVTRALGQPTRQWHEDQEMVLGQTLVSDWDLDGGRLRVEALPDGANLVELVELRLDEATDLRVALGHGLVAGRSTMAEAVAAWAADGSPQVVPAADGTGADAVGEWVHGMSWGACDGPYPMVVFFGHRVAAAPGTTYDTAAPRFDRTLMDRPFTDVRFTWADADPETSGCMGSSPGTVMEG